MRRRTILSGVTAMTLLSLPIDHATADESAFVWSRSTDGDFRAEDHGVRQDTATEATRPRLQPQATACPFADKLTTAALRVGLQPAIAIAVAHAETRCRHVGQRSPKGAMGLMQLMPATARRFGAADPWDIDQNIAAGVAYLAWLQDRYRGDLARTLAGYNAGEGAVDRYGGVPPFAETRAYVAAISNDLGNPPVDTLEIAVEPVIVASTEPVFVMTLSRDVLTPSRAED